jgi:phage shock protein PspC (stress-responsive transcriptional regulator)
MNKTLSVNIGGIVFHIEEQAYDRLNRYLDSIKGYFTSSDGRDEIITDIEARLGEMFQERITGGKQVIVESDVEQVINLMGKPEQFAEAAGDETSNEQRSTASERRAYRRLYRDDDDRVVGGVCSGFSHYLGLDPLWLRAAFAISFFAFGSGFFLYIILMIIMPKARTTAEKLEMRGEKVNLSNIKKSFQDEVGSIKSNFDNQNNRSSAARFFDTIGELIVGGFRLIGKVIAAFFILIGIIILVAFGMAFMAILGVGSITIPFFITDMFMEPWQQTFALVGGFLLIGIPVIMIIYKAVKALFNIKTDSKALNWSALALWIVGLGLMITVGSSIANELRTKETSRIEIPISQPLSDTLSLGVLNHGEENYDWDIDGDKSVSFPWSATEGMDTIIISNVRLNVVRSNSDKFELLQISSSRGANRKDAYKNANDIVYTIAQDQSNLNFHESFRLPKGTKFRNQEVQLLLKIPIGKSIYLSPEMDDLIYDIKNVTNTYDGHMLGRTWTMTDQGLACIGCNLTDQNSDYNNKDVSIRINDQGVKVEGADGKVDSSFTITSDDVKIKINNEGVQIDTTKKK